MSASRTGRGRSPTARPASRWRTTLPGATILRYRHPHARPRTVGRVALTAVGPRPASPAGANPPPRQFAEREKVQRSPCVLHRQGWFFHRLPPGSLLAALADAPARQVHHHVHGRNEEQGQDRTEQQTADDRIA